MPRVILLKPGSIRRDESGRILDARSSVSLIISASSKIVVDTGQDGDEGLILNALAGLRVRPEEINMVVNTHSHPDHCGNNQLFSNAEILVPKEGEAIAPGVIAMETPGHTLDSVSVLVRSAKVVILAGDALPTFSNFLKNVPPALHVDRDLAVASMARVIRAADVVVPGHDRPFSVKGREYVSLSD